MPSTDEKNRVLHPSQEKEGSRKKQQCNEKHHKLIMFVWSMMVDGLVLLEVREIVEVLTLSHVRGNLRNLRGSHVAFSMSVCVCLCACFVQNKYECVIHCICIN